MQLLSLSAEAISWLLRTQYTVDVLLAEAIVRIHMAVFGVDQSTAQALVDQLWTTDQSKS